MDEITLKRGLKEVTFKKKPRLFAVRLKQGRARDEMTLESHCGSPPAEVRHVDYAAPTNMEIFAVKEAGDLEKTTDELRRAPAADVVTHIYTIDETPGGQVIPTGNMTIQFKPEVGATEREKILAEFGLEVVKDLDHVSHGYRVRLTGKSQENPLKIAFKLQERKEVETAEPDLSFQISFKHMPRDLLYPEQWHLKNRGNRVGLKAGADVKAEEAWDYTTGVRAITVCVIDDGFDLAHPDFDAPDKIVAPRPLDPRFDTMLGLGRAIVRKPKVFLCN